MPNRRLQRVVEQSLNSAWGGNVALEPGDQNGLSGRDYVHRFRVGVAPAGSPSSIIVKRPRKADEELTRFFNEWACLELLTECCPEPPAPRVYAGDADHRFLAMEDLGASERLDHAFLGGDPTRATEMLVGLMQALGQMHAATFGQRARFDAIFSEHARRPPPPRIDRSEQRQKAIEDALKHLAVPAGPRFLDEMADLGRRVESADTEALIHGDPCPDNCQYVAGRVRLLDFEHGRFGNVFSDGSYPRIVFPTCWCLGRLPNDVADRALDAYRRVLALRMPHAAAEPRFTEGMTDASIVWAWQMFAGWHMPDVLSKDHEWGLATVRQRILFRFALVLSMLERDGRYPAIAETTRRTREALAARWKDLGEILLYPAFR
jgi:tRNA A-37 threonylcarbamoyl transferase component Bud32